MQTGYIRFSETNDIEIELTDGTVWMTANEIADLFGVHILTTNKNLKEIFKSNLLRECEVTKEYRYTCPKYGECIRIYYNLEMITCLSFKIQSPLTGVFRKWVFRSLYEKTPVGNLNSGIINCDSIIKEFSLLNLN